MLKISRSIILAFTFSILYWIYVGYVSQIALANDAIAYDNLGSLIYNNGWGDFFRTGPHREPFYPFLISVTMSLGKLFSISYHIPQKIIQFSFLLLTQILSLIILKKLKINNFLCACIILYIGFSPAFVNSSLSLFSEIAAYPFILLTVIFASTSYKNILITKKGRSTQKLSLLLAFLLGTSILMITFVKGIFELFIPFLLIPFCIMLIKTYRLKQKEASNNILAFIIIAALSFYLPFNAYKLANKKYNGNFTFTTRGSEVLYAETKRRMDNFSAKNWLTALVYVPGHRYCEPLFGNAACAYWTPLIDINKLLYNHKDEISDAPTTSNAFKKILLMKTFKRIFKNPFAYTLMTATVGLKLFFWESSKLGHVAYPDWMDKIFWNPGLENILNFSVALLSFLAFLYLIKFIWQHRKNIFAFKTQNNEVTCYLLFVFLILSVFMTISSLFIILTRYMLPIAPLYLIIIAFTIQQIVNRIKSRHS